MIIIMSRARKYACRICLWLKLFFRAPQCEPSLREKWLPNKKYSLSWTWNVPTPNNAIHGGFSLLASTAKTKTTTVRARFTNLSKETRSTVTFGVVCFIFFAWQDDKSLTFLIFPLSGFVSCSPSPCKHEGTCISSPSSKGESFCK